MGCLLFLSLLLVAGGLCVPLGEGDAPPLGTYNVDIYQTSVSGLSSGGFFAVQMHVAFSSVMQGAGVFAGGPYHCSEGNLNTALSDCMDTNKEPKVAPLISLTNDRAQTGLVDPPSNLATQKVFMFSGTKDDTVAQPVMNGLRDYYENFINASQIFYENTVKAAHTQPTDDNINTNACDNSSPPYISYCDYDGSGKALNQIYGNLNARNNGQLSGSLNQFNQKEFVGNNLGMASSGWMYIPQSCASGKPCKLHVSFHGCKQDYNAIGSDWIQDTGYNKWADTNNMIILYPQTEKSIRPYNPYGCWDWWGYNNPDNFDTKNGDQMNAVWEMIMRITGGFLSPPSSLSAYDITNQSVSLKWQASPTSGVAYNVYRNGTKVNTDPISGLQFKDEPVSPGMFYSYTVMSVDTSQHQSSPSNAIVVQTLGQPPSILPPQNLASSFVALSPMPSQSQLTSSHSEVTASFAVITWDSATGAVEYNVYRNGVFLASSETSSFNDTTVSPLTSYNYQVTSVNGTGQESFRSSTLEVTTPGSWRCVSVKSSNYQHVQKGRAYQKWGYAYAVGSNELMGLDNTAIHTTLSETSEGYYVIGSC